MRSHEKPIRSMTPGPRFATKTPACGISFSQIVSPSGVLVFNPRDFLLLFSWVKYSESTLGMSRSWWRVTSPTSTRSTFNTSALNHASCWSHAGPACTWVKSIILIPSRGKLMIKVSLLVRPVPRHKSNQLPDAHQLLKHLRCQTAERPSSCGCDCRQQLSASTEL